MTHQGDFIFVSGEVDWSVGCFGEKHSFLTSGLKIYQQQQQQQHPSDIQASTVQPSSPKITTIIKSQH